jgi:hypothetical protein
VGELIRLKDAGVSESDIARRLGRTLIAVKLETYKLARPNRVAEARQKAREILRARAKHRATDPAEIIKRLQANGADSLREIAAGLNAEGIQTARGQGEWSAVQVRRVLARLPS